ncbi:MAG: hypothetical protein ACRCYS_01430 [Beijerinckiaceae bacterium]
MFEWKEWGPIALAHTGPRQAYMLGAELFRDGKPLPVVDNTPAIVTRSFWDNEAKAREEIERDKWVVEARHAQ